MVVIGFLPTGHVTQRMRENLAILVNITRLNIIMAVKQEIVNVDTSYLSHCWKYANLNRIMQNIPQKGRGLGHVTPQVFGIGSNISSKLLQLEISNLVTSFIFSFISSRLHEVQASNLIHGFVFGNPSVRTSKFPQRGVA